MTILNYHLDDMNRLSKKKWKSIKEKKGFQIISDRAYQGMDGGIHPWWTEPRFWCRSIEVKCIATGKIGWGIGPQSEAYEMAVKNASADR